MTFFFTAFAYDGVLSGNTNVKVIKTKWFDIIYPEGSERTAELLYQNADKIYEEVGEMYGFPPKYRMPVTIASKVESFNGLWAGAVYNRIVLYDTFLIDDLNVFSNQLLSAFRHEVTHAYTMNLKNAFWNMLSFFADAFNPAMLFITSGWAEGATLTSESSAGEGRLNDEYAKQMVKQAKLENLFPSYSDIQGASTKNPVGSFYYFNGAFDQWLQKEYGMEKYAKFWYKCVNFQTISTMLAFKSVYGIKINDAWKKFKESVEVPSIPNNPIQTGYVFDFFESTKFSADENLKNNSYSIMNNSSSLYQNICVCDTGIVFQDKNAITVYYVSKDDLENDKIKPQKLFSKSNVSSLSLSKDGHYLAVEYYSLAYATVTKEVKIYDMQKKQFTNFVQKSVSAPAIVQKDNSYYLITSGYKDQVYSVNIQTLFAEDDDFKTFNLPLGEYFTSYTDIGNGQFAYIKESKLNYSICISDLQGNILKEYVSPYERMVIKHLSFDSSKNELGFSWTKPGSMPRFGVLNLNSQNYSLQQTDLCGGVYYPVVVEDKIIYEGTFFRQNRMFIADKSSVLNHQPQNLTENELVLAAKLDSSGRTEIKSEKELAPVSLDYANPKKYNDFNYFRGVFIPVSTYVSQSIDRNNSTSDYALPFGVTYMTANPWMGNMITGSIGYGVQTCSWGLDLIYTGGTDTSLFKYGFDGYTEVDLKGWKQSGLTANASVSLPFGIISKLNFSDTASGKIGRNNKIISLSLDSLRSILNYYTFGVATFDEIQNSVNFQNVFNISYSNVHRVGPGMYENLGFSVSAELVNEYMEDITNWQNRYIGNNLSLSCSVSVPKLLPLKCMDGFSYNLPAGFSVSFLPYTGTKAAAPGVSTDSLSSILGGSSGVSNSVPRKPALFAVNATTLMFALEIDKAIPFLPGIFLNRCEIYGLYRGTYYLDSSENSSNWFFTQLPEVVQNGAISNGIYAQYAGAELVIKVGPNFGMIASALHLNLIFDFGVKSVFYPNQPTTSQFDFDFSLGISI